MVKSRRKHWWSGRCEGRRLLSEYEWTMVMVTGKNALQEQRQVDDVDPNQSDWGTTGARPGLDTPVPNSALAPPGCRRLSKVAPASNGNPE